jgi:lipoate-protein ligase A
VEVLRFISDKPIDPYYNMAVDEAIAISVGGGKSPPTLRFYGWKPFAVSIGYFQELEEEVDLDFCASHGIHVVRRITGGGAVFHGNGELTYSLAVPVGDEAIPQDMQTSYEVICSPIVAALRGIGADAVFRPVNDIEVGGRKISGNAQTRRFGVVLQHGTILVSLDRAMLPSLRVKKEKLEIKGFDSVAKRVTSLEDVLGHEVGIPSLARVLAGEFQKAFACPMRSASLTEGEKRLIPALVEKYASRCWLWRR